MLDDVDGGGEEDEAILGEVGKVDGSVEEGMVEREAKRRAPLRFAVTPEKGGPLISIY